MFVDNSITKVLYTFEPAQVVDVLGVQVPILSKDELTNRFINLLLADTRGWITYVNVHAINLANSIPWFKEFLNKSLITYCDGKGVSYAIKFLYDKSQDQIALSDWIYDICGGLERLGKRVFLLGSTPKVVSTAASKLQSLFPQLQIAGSYHGYFSSIEENSIVELINLSRADVLIVGMGMPKQEEWIRQHYNELQVKLILNGGSVFDFVAGTKMRCPRWMGNIGLEWLFRLLQEPHRLWKRYLIGNPLFLWKVFAHRISSNR
ncbi:MAG: WecB/TagA/CpsF family glycosyltransferase [Bacteroidetes bacterium]|nr:WecB/TagA/CpsF family glycosyltransferase [Bacteroidota bacterium]